MTREYKVRIYELFHPCARAEPFLTFAGLSQQSSPSKPLQNRSSTLSYNTISTASSRSSYSTRPSQPFAPSHTRDPSSSTSLPSSKSHSQTHLLDFPLPSTSKTMRIRNRTSSLSLARTPSNTSSASSTNQGDSPITPAREKGKGKGREINEDWERGLPVLGPASPERKGPAMVDPRFTFPRRAGGGGRLGVVGPMGELRRGSDESEKRRQERENSFVASL